MKRILSLILPAIIAISNLSFCTTAKAQEVPKRSSYTVLVFDWCGYGLGTYGSGVSAYGDAICISKYGLPTMPDKAEKKKIAKRFVSILAQKNRLEQANVAIVLYGGYEPDVVTTGFSSDLGYVTSQIDSMNTDQHYYDGLSCKFGEYCMNISDGLATANNLLEGIKDKSAEKNVILFSSGWSNCGNTKDEGHYSKYQIGEEYKPCDNRLTDYEESKLNAYMNCAYDEAQKIKNMGTDLYVIHNIADNPSWDLDNNKNAVEQYLNLREYFGAVDLDLASSKDHFYPLDNSYCYSVSNDVRKEKWPYPEVENFRIENKTYASYSCAKEAIDDIANKIAHNEDNPIVIVPGIMGSRIFMDASARYASRSDRLKEDWNKNLAVWPPVYTEAVSNLGLYLENRTYRVRPCENQNVNCKYDEIEANNKKEGILKRGWNAIRDCSGYLINLISKTESSETHKNTECNNEGTVKRYGREYGADDSYKNLVEKLCEEYSYCLHKKYREVYFFSYDWLANNEHTAYELKKAIRDILDETGSKKVDIVAHSMGGLITSKYFSESSVNKEKVNRVITCGTPYEGSPESMVSLQALKFVDDDSDIGKGIFEILRRHVKDRFEGDFFELKPWEKDMVLRYVSGLSPYVIKSMDSLKQLLPTDNYLYEVPMQKKVEVKTVLDPLTGCGIKFFKKSNVGPKEFKESRYKFFGFVNNCYDITQSFQRSIQVKNKNYNVLLDYDKAYFGIGINQKTIKSVCFDTEEYPAGIHSLEYENEGDGTVPYLSASMMDKIGDRCCRFETNHMGVIQNEDCIDWIIDILNNGSSEISSADFSHKPYMTINIADEADIVIEKNGETLSSNPENPSFTTSFGRLDLLKTSEEGKYIKCLCIDSDTDYQLSFKTENDRPVQLSVQFFNGDGSLKDSKMLALDSANGSNICETFNDFIGQNIA